MDYEVSKTRLKNYFSTVTYIDDKFDHCIVDEPILYSDEEIEDSPPLPMSYAAGTLAAEGFSSEGVFTEQKEIEHNLNAILTELNSEKYAEVRLTPILFDNKLNKDVLVRKIQESPLTLIDWNLGQNDKAFDFVNCLFAKTKQLKVIVVYTSNYLEAIESMRTDPQLKDCPEITTSFSNFSCFRCNKQSLIAVVDKQSYNLDKILDIISDIFIDNCGLMPIAVLDYMASAQRISDELFGSFCRPFEDIYWLQMYFSELSEGDIPAAIIQFIQNKICEACTIEPSISSEMFTHYKKRLQEFVSMDDKVAASSFHKALDTIRPHLQGSNAEICDAISSMDYSEIKSVCTQALEGSKTWREVTQKFASALSRVKEILAEKKMDPLLQPFLDLEGSEDRISRCKEAISKELMKGLNTQWESFSTEIIPVLLQILVSSTKILDSGVELVRNLKYRSYVNQNLEDILKEGATLNRPKKAEYLKNVFHFGDILIRENNDNVEYLLCISPPCDVCRPDKVKLNICFIKGCEIPEHELNVRRKENVHISILPIDKNGKESLNYVAWRLFDVVKFDLGNKEEYAEICTYTRPFMMSEQYSRQIGNLFTAYFSRAGVDELFMKSASGLRAIFG